MVSRWDCMMGSTVRETAAGEFVTYEEYATLEAENAKLRAELERRVPDGFALVPVEPTPEMVSAAEEAHMPFGDMDIALRMAISAAPSAPKADDPVKGDIDDMRAALARSASPVKRAIDLLQNYRASISARRYPDNDEGDAMERRDYVEEKHAELCVYGLREVLVSAIAAARQEGGK